GPKPPRRPVPPAAPTPAASAAPAGVSPASGTSVSEAAAAAPAASQPGPASAGSESLPTISNGGVPPSLSHRGARLTSFVLTGHFDEQKKPLELVRTLPPELPKNLSLDFGADTATTTKLSQALFVVERDANDRVRFRYADAGVAVEKEIRLGKGYLF